MTWPSANNNLPVSAFFSLQTASTSQVLALALLRHWGHEGFLSHVSRVADFYRHKRDVFVAAAERHLTGKATWEVPNGGMFLWINLLLPPGLDSFEAIRRFAVTARVLAVPGVGFLPSGRKTLCCFVRASFSLVETEEDAEEACRRIGLLVDLARAAAGTEANGNGYLHG